MKFLLRYLLQNYSYPSVLNLKWLKFSPDDHNMWENQVGEYVFLQDSEYWRFFARIGIKPPIFKMSQTYSLTLFPHMLWSSGENFIYFEPKFVGRESFCVRYPKIPFFPEIYERSNQISDWNCNNFSTKLNSDILQIEVIQAH